MGAGDPPHGEHASYEVAQCAPTLHTLLLQPSTVARSAVQAPRAGRCAAVPTSSVRRHTLHLLIVDSILVTIREQLPPADPTDDLPLHRAGVLAMHRE